MAKTELNKMQLTKIRRVVETHDAWDMIILYAEDFKRRIHEEQPTGRNAFETLRDLHKKQGAVDGLDRFLEELSTIKISKDDE